MTIVRGYLHGYTGEIDERDEALLRKRMLELDAIEGPRCGDYVVFADGITRRISYIWHFDDGVHHDFAQTSDAGSYYLGNGYVSMSGSLYPGVRLHTLTLTDERRVGWVWFFHHDRAWAHNGVDVQADFRVYTCPLPAPK